MTPLSDDDLDGLSQGIKYPDETVVRAFCMRTDRDKYPSRWASKPHYGATGPDPPRTLTDGTIRRYDNSHERTNGHGLHTPPNQKPKLIEFPGMLERWNRFWSEIPKPESQVD